MADGGEQNGGHNLDPIAGAVRTYLWVPDSQPPPNWSMAREMSVAKLMMRYGEEPEDIVEAIRGVAELRELNELGSLAKRGEKMTLKIFTTAKSHGIPLYKIALHRRRKHGADESEAAAATISEALRAAGEVD